MLLPDHFLTREAFFEHHQFYKKQIVDHTELKFYKQPIYFRSKTEIDHLCFRINGEGQPETNYYVGIDWLCEKQQKAIYVQPKLNKTEDGQIDYVKMLFTMMSDAETQDHISDAIEIKWDQKPIVIADHADLLTPFLMVQYLLILKKMVQKGLKRAYYKTEQNLNSRQKGKILIADTIRKNTIRSRTLYTYCSFEVFGYDHLENRLLKKGLLFVKKYLSTYNTFQTKSLIGLLNYIEPAFADVSDDVSIYDIKAVKVNALYKEYEEGIKMAKRILQRFGYNISTITSSKSIATPPFWIDMSKVFELYVLAILKKKFAFDLKYHFKANGNEPDYLLRSPQHTMIIDAKYKPVYKDTERIEDIRQVSGYARNRSILKELGFETEDAQNNALVKCLIIYPDQTADSSFENKFQMLPIANYVEFYRLPVRLPEITIPI